MLFFLEVLYFIYILLVSLFSSLTIGRSLIFNPTGSKDLHTPSTEPLFSWWKTDALYLFCMFFSYFIFMILDCSFSLSLTMFIVAVYCNKIPRLIPSEWKPFWFWFLIGRSSGFIEWLGTFPSSSNVLFEYSSRVSVTVVVAVQRFFVSDLCLFCYLSLCINSQISLPSWD